MARVARTSALLLALCGLGFASLGLPDGVLGVAWPSMRSDFALPLDALGALLISVTLGYVFSSFASGWILSRVGLGTLLALSCAVTAASLIGYARAPSWAVIVAFGSFAGLGAGAIDAGINTYVASRHSPRTLGLMHAAYGLGTTAGPILMTSVLMRGAGWGRGYAILGVAQLALALGFGATRRLWPTDVATSAPAALRAASSRATLRLPAAWLGIATFFLYVGLEACAGAWIYSLLAGPRGASTPGAGLAVSLYWGGLLGGRLLLGVLPEARDPSRVVRGCIAAAGVAAALLAIDLGAAPSIAAIAGFGLAAGPIFPLLIATTPRRLGPAHAANAVGFQVAGAALGQALLPAALGLAADAFGLERVPQALLLGAGLLLAAHALLARAARGARAPHARRPASETVPG